MKKVNIDPSLETAAQQSLLNYALFAVISKFRGELVLPLDLVQSASVGNSAITIQIDKSKNTVTLTMLQGTEG